MIKLALAALTVAANPGVLPNNVVAPGAPAPVNQFVFDGGVGSLPGVVNMPLYSPAYFNQAGTVVAASGFDGGIVPGNLAIETGQVITGGGVVNANLQHQFNATTPGFCICSAEIVAGASQGSLSGCVLTSDGGQSQLALTSDGGLFGYICIGQ